MKYESKPKYLSLAIVNVCFYSGLIISLVSLISLTETFFFNRSSVQNELLVFTAFLILTIMFYFVKAKVCYFIETRNQSYVYKKIGSGQETLILVFSGNTMSSLIILGFRFVVFKIDGIRYVFIPKNDWLAPLCPFWFGKYEL
jgi:hypothetical protein